MNEGKSGDAHRRVIMLRRQFARRVQRVLSASFQVEGCVQKMDIVRIVGCGINALRPALRDVVLVGRDGLIVHGGGIGIAAHTDVGVGRHVYQMPGGGNQPAEAVGHRHR